MLSGIVWRTLLYPQLGVKCVKNNLGGGAERNDQNLKRTQNDMKHPAICVKSKSELQFWDEKKEWKTIFSFPKTKVVYIQSCCSCREIIFSGVGLPADRWTDTSPDGKARRKSKLSWLADPPPLLGWLRPNPHRTPCTTRHKQMGPVNVNGGVHTAPKQHQKKKHSNLRVSHPVCVDWARPPLADPPHVMDGYSARPLRWLSVLVMSRADMLYEGAKDCTGGFMSLGFAGTFEQNKPSLQKSMDKYLPLFEKVCMRFRFLGFHCKIPHFVPTKV